MALLTSLWPCGPLDQDEPGAVDTSTLDSVENAMDLDAENLSTQHIFMGTIAEQAPLTPAQLMTPHVFFRPRE